MSQDHQLPPEILAHYQAGIEQARLASGVGSLELQRTQELLRRYLPSPPASVLDVGGGPGRYAAWLAREGYTVRLVDVVPLHVEQALAVAASQPLAPFSAVLGDARRLDEPDRSYDAVLLMGPLYHLTEHDDRLAALREAHRVLRAGGRLCATAVSRFAPLMDGLRLGFLAEPDFARMLERDLLEGQHRNPRPDRLEWFTTAYLHHPEDLASELGEAGFTVDAVLGIEGPGWLFEERWTDPRHQPAILQAARAVEQERTLLGLSAHLLAVASA